MHAFDNGLPLPGERQAAPSPSAPLSLTRMDDDALEVVARVPVAAMARAVLTQLGSLERGRVVVIGGRSQA